MNPIGNYSGFLKSAMGSANLMSSSKGGGAAGDTSAAFSMPSAQQLFGEGVESTLPDTTPKGLAPVTATGEMGSDFSNMLRGLVRDVSQKSAEAGQAISGVLTGEPIPLHQAMIAAEESSISFQLMVEVRNKLLESYQELMRMQV